jgi:hypothetical protein
MASEMPKMLVGSFGIFQQISARMSAVRNKWSIYAIFRFCVGNSQQCDQTRDNFGMSVCFCLFKSKPILKRLIMVSGIHYFSYADDCWSGGNVLKNSERTYQHFGHFGNSDAILFWEHDWISLFSSPSENSSGKRSFFETNQFFTCISLWGNRD